METDWHEKYTDLDARRRQALEHLRHATDGLRLRNLSPGARTDIYDRVATAYDLLAELLDPDNLLEEMAKP